MTKKNQVPNKLRREINNAYEDEKVRDEFIKDLIPMLDNFSSNLVSVENAESVLRRK